MRTITLDAETAIVDLDRATALVSSGQLRSHSTTDDEAASYRHALATEIKPPSDKSFELADEDFLDSEPMARLAAKLIEDWPELSHIASTRVVYSWKRKGGRRQGKFVAGKCTPLSGYAKYRAQAEFHIWLAADVVREAAFGPHEIEAMLYHELNHIGWEEDEDENSTTYGETKIKGVDHDFAGFWSELSRYGAWQGELRTTEQEFRQLALIGDGEGA